jgi:REP element-mobilizing transposase RayT
VTICVQEKDHHLFGEVIAGKMQLSHFGEIVLKCWNRLPRHYPNAILDEFVVMPNHVHGIILTYPLSEIIRGFKTFSARRINELRGIAGVPVWQRNYWEYIIRNEGELQRIREYIINNPMKWEEDKMNPVGHRI